MGTLLFFLSWSPTIVFGALFIATFLLYVVPFFRPARERGYQIEIIVVILFRIAYDAIRTYAQYKAFASNGISQYLLPPYVSWHYFAGYTFQRFWLATLITFVVAF